MKSILILGIVSVVISIVPILGIIALVPAIIALILNHKYSKKDGTSNKAGLILCIIALSISAIWILLLFIPTTHTVSPEKVVELENKLNESLKEIEKLSQTEKQKEIQEKINSLQKESDNLSTKISELENEKKALETNIQNLKGDIIKVKSSPKNYPAGYLKAGTDFDVGRYKIYNGNSNFIVYSSTGSLRVNIILGESYGFGVNEYIYTFSYGDEIQASSSFTMVPVN